MTECFEQWSKKKRDVFLLYKNPVKKNVFLEK